MLKVINATGDGACLFNAVAIGLGIEILSGRIDAQQNTQAYRRLLDEFARQHPNFNPKSWDNLKQWLAFYNHSRDIELIFAPVLLKLNEHYNSQLDSEILNEVTNLVWKNRVNIQNQASWFFLMNNELFPKIDNLELGVKTHLVERLRSLLQGTSETLDRVEVKEFLTINAKNILSELKILIKQDPKAFQRGYHCGELKEMTDALCLNLVENNTSNSENNPILIRLRNVNQHWDITVSNADYGLVNKSLQQLNMTSAEAFSGQRIVAAPVIAQPKEEITVEIKKETIDNPGKGNCAFYAFAIGLINIIQEEGSYGCKDMFNRLLHSDVSLANQYEAIIRFDKEKPDEGLLDRLQNMLRFDVYHHSLNELKAACANPADNYRQLIANSFYGQFCELYYDNYEANFNVFADSAEIKNAVNIDRSKVRANQENEVLVPIFLALVYGTKIYPSSITPDTVPLINSPVIRSMAKITKNFVWGTHLDLDYLSRNYKVNLHTLQNGMSLQTFQDISDQHTITINNIANAHWVTEVLIAKSLESEQPPIIPPAKEVNAPLLNPTLFKTEHKISGESKHVKSLNSSGLASINPVVTVNENNLKNTLLDKPAESDETKLIRLKDKVAKATMEYTEYSNKIWFSLFHHHGKAGRERAEKFNKDFGLIKGYKDAKSQLLAYLNDNSNGNTHPHSFRTMLLHVCQPEGKQKATLYETSKNFGDLLRELMKTLNNAVNTLIFN